jgi:hypothetical protein
MGHHSANMVKKKLNVASVVVQPSVSIIDKKWNVKSVKAHRYVHIIKTKNIVNFVVVLLFVKMFGVQQKETENMNDFVFHVM